MSRCLEPLKAEKWGWNSQVEDSFYGTISTIRPGPLSPLGTEDGWMLESEKKDLESSFSKRGSLQWYQGYLEPKKFAKHTHRIHVWYIYTHIWLIYMVNVGKYTIHGSYGKETEIDFLEVSSWWRLLRFSRNEVTKNLSRYSMKPS